MPLIENTDGRPNPADFPDHRVYLRAMIAHLKTTQVAFSYRYFSKRAGLKSPNFLKLVAEGKRNIAPPSISRFASGLGLNAKEREAFEALVMFGQASTDSERNIHYQRLQKLRAGHGTAKLEAAQYQVYSLWYAIPIRELMLTEVFREDPEWIARKLRPRIRPREARAALELLEKTGLATRDADGKLRASDTKIATPATVRSLAVRNYHRAMLDLSAKSLDSVPVEKRNLTSLTVALSPAQYEFACRRIAEFREELLDQIEDIPAAGQPREIHILGFQAVPVTGEDDHD